MSTSTKLTVKEKVGYALGDTAANIAWRTVSYFLPIFYTDVFGLEAAVAATLLFNVSST
jgi:GPH family glycoside/pentoside/hexuronide:cation symporter